MKKITRVRDSLNLITIYVSECDKFSYEFQKDMPELNKKYIQGYIKRENVKIEKKCNIMYQEEDYYSQGVRYKKLIGGGIKYLN